MISDSQVFFLAFWGLWGSQKNVFGTCEFHFFFVQISVFGAWKQLFGAWPRPQKLAQDRISQISQHGSESILERWKCYMEHVVSKISRLRRARLHLKLQCHVIPIPYSVHIDRLATPMSNF